ncbi:DNA repair protein RadC [Clostridioides difficile]|nr:DNA repair protein RadC [Clostridioides difficile]
MSEVIVITSGKGGVGKTTTAANLGTALSLENKKTVVVDADIGLRNLDVVVLLNTKNEIISDVDVSIGTLSSSLVHPREVFKEAIRRSASKIIVMHNHPSGSVEPSREDKNITSRLIKCGEIIGIEIIDHIIIGDGLYFSFKENMII